MRIFWNNSNVEMYFMCNFYTILNLIRFFRIYTFKYKLLLTTPLANSFFPIFIFAIFWDETILYLSQEVPHQLS